MYPTKVCTVLCPGYNVVGDLDLHEASPNHGEEELNHGEEEDLDLDHRKELSLCTQGRLYLTGMQGDTKPPFSGCRPCRIYFSCYGPLCIKDILYLSNPRNGGCGDALELSY